MSKLYGRLGHAGLTRQYVRSTALPSWWEDEIAANPAGYAQGLLLLARHLGLDLRTLQDDAAPVQLRDFGVCKYKKRDSVSQDELSMCRTLATRAAQLAAEATATPYQGLPGCAAEIRQAILDRGARWVGLSELLDYCWSVGVPVLHLDHFPKNARRPDGFAARVGGRPVVVLCVRKRQPAWLLFILAHELGHIVRGHITEDGAILDDRVAEDSQDAEELEANTFAAELLTGTPPRRFRAEARWPNAEELAAEARRLGRQQMIDPGHVILNYAHAMGRDFYAVATAALARLDPRANAVDAIRSVMADRLDWSRLPDDSSEFLMRVTRHQPTA
ncbi:MAG: ImmA/IrrE family metallo-endopeptidase [Gemmataceae bacterium]